MVFKETDQELSLQSGLPWPKAYSRLLNLVQQKLGSEGTFCLTRELSGGKSGAFVYVADVHCPSYTGQVILKLDEDKHPERKEQSEPQLLTKAISDAPGFAKEHLPRLLFTVRFEGQSAILSTIAGRGLEYVDPWPEVDFEQQLSVTKQFAADLLTEWNQDYRLSGGLHMPQELLASWLGHRLNTAEGGRIHEFLLHECRLDPASPSMTFEGQWYPNPLAFADNVVSIPDRLQLRAVRGHCHGDLHGLNLLVGHANSKESEYFLIDLADYQDRQFLFFDHAYFEIAYLLTARSDTSASYWEAVFEKLSRRHSQETNQILRADDLGLMQIINAIRHETDEWIERQEHDRLSYMESQYLLARVASGLSFTHKIIDCQKRRIAFLYAASNLKDYLKLNRLEWPKDGPTFLITHETGSKDTGPLNKSLKPPQKQPVEQSSSSTPDIIPDRSHTVSRSKDRVAKRSFFTELRRRQVFKAAAGYIVVAWLCLQVAIVMHSSLNLPEWTDSLVVTLLALGFPIACILAWAYELSPKGLQRTTPISGIEDRPSRLGAAADYILGIGLLLILLVSVANPIYERFAPNASISSEEGSSKSIAVLPFRNLSDADERDYFADGLTIEIINTLAKTGKFRVPGQHSLFNYKGKDEDLRTIGKKLGVEYILEGSVRKSGDDFRVEAQLVQANDGFLIWSDVFDEDLHDLVKVQQELALDIGIALQVPMQTSTVNLEGQRTSNTTAYQLYLQALGLFAQRGKKVEEAAEKLSESVRIDPGFAAGWAALSLVYDVLPAFVDNDESSTSSLEAYSKAAEFASKAYSLDPNLPIAQHAMGNKFRRNGEWSRAEDMYRNALDARPDAHQVLKDYGELLSTVGRHQQAIAMTENAVAIDPLNSLYEYTLLEVRWHADPGEESAENMISFFEKDTPFQQEAARAIIGYLTKEGQLERLTELITNCATCDAGWRERVLKMIGDVNETPADKLYKMYGEEDFVGYLFLETVGGSDLVFNAFQEVIDPNNPPVANRSVPWSVISDVGSDDRFKQLIEKWGLLAYWRERGWPDKCKPLEGGNFECT